MLAPELHPLGLGAPQVGDELAASSTTCCSQVLQLWSCKEGFCRLRPLAHPLEHGGQPACHRLVLLGPTGRQEPEAGGTAARGRRAAGESDEVAGRRSQRGWPLRWGRAPAPFC